MVVIDVMGLPIGLYIPEAWIHAGFLPFVCNRVEPVEGLQKLALLFQRMVADHFTPGALGRTMNDLAPTARALTCARLSCRMDDEAAETAVDYARRRMRQEEMDYGYKDP